MTDVGSRLARGPRYARPLRADTERTGEPRDLDTGTPRAEAGNGRHMLERLQPSGAQAIPSVDIAPA